MKLACSHLGCNQGFDFLRRDVRVETRVDLGNQRVDRDADRSSRRRSPRAPAPPGSR